MKLIVFFLSLTAMLFGSGISATAQQTASDTFRIGNRQIAIPAPAGFVEAASEIDVIRERLTATEAAGNDFIASHLPKVDFQLLKAGEEIDLTFYTKGSVAKSLKNRIATQADFKTFVEAFKKYFPSYSDPKGTLMKSTLKRASENMSAVNREKTTFSIDKPYNVGEIANTATSYGIVVLSQFTMTVGDVEQSKLMLAGMSAILVRGKIVFIYTYKNYENEQDIDDLKSFSGTWLKQIAAANK